MNPVEIIKLKRNGNALSRDQIKYLIEGYLDGNVTEYQMAAFLMAVYFNNMNEDETFYLTEIMLNSGTVLDLSHIKNPKVDKHSTGGVGDKTSLILAPLVASCGIYVPMISGRGLGHTGGTLDKLESITGFNVNYEIEDFKRILETVGLVMLGQTSELAPADKRIYALRDVTATVESIPLITSSIMSKKLAEGADALVFDVKIGVGANLPDKDESIQLAKKLISTSKKFGKKAIAVLSDMEQPLGMKIGNWLEIEECIEMMNGKLIPDLYKLTNVLAGAMLYLGDAAGSIEEGEKIALQKISDKSAYKKFLEMVEIQNGDVSYVKDWANLKRPEFSKLIKAEQDGFISEMHASDFGYAAIELGCGRKKTDDKIDYLAGIILHKKCGNEIRKGDVICELFSDDKLRIDIAEKRLEQSIKISKIKPKVNPLIIDILD
ncbi:MAG TPA: thymidine phosphorylase [Ignavibacteria bacterium]|nr:thymidine phosphorylase [Ignavibacteria bacterium]HRA98886.1 thymidine phosphorylase [Ignavibacteria bacterium]